MKYPFITVLGLLICLLVSCDDMEVEPTVIEPSVPDNCIDIIIDDLTANDNSPDCLASVSEYIFEGATVFAIQEEVCVDGSHFILNESCDTLCVINVFGQSVECSNSNNFFEDAEFVEVLWQEEN